MQADRLEHFAGEVMEDIGGALALLLAFMGDQTGIYRSLRAQAGQARLEEVLREAGFTRIRRATETDTNMVLEARP